MKEFSWFITLLTLILSGCTAIESKPENNANPATDTPPSSTQQQSPEQETRPFPDDSLYHLLVAEFAVRRQQYKMALDNYTLQAKETRDIKVILRATRLAQFLNNDDAVLNTAQLWIELDANNVEAQYTVSTQLAKAQQPLIALTHMEKVLINHGKTNFTAIAATALTASPSKQRELLAALEALITKHPNHGQLYTSRAILEQHQGNIKTALQSTRKGIALDDNDLQAVVIESRLLQQLERTDDVFIRLEATLKKHPLNRKLRLQYARLLLKNNLPKAFEQFKTLLIDTPEDPDLLTSLALISREQQNKLQTTHYLKRLLKTGKRDNEARFYLAQLAEQNNHIDQAIIHYQAISIGRDYLAASKRIAELYLSKSQLSKAQTLLKNRREQYPKISIQLYFIEAELLFKLKRFDQSYQFLSAALINHPLQENLLYMRSIASEKMGNTQLMEEDLRAIIKQNPDNITALNALGYVLADRSEKLDEAFILINKAHRLKPKDPAILDSLGWVEYRRGNLTTAVKILQRAYNQYPDPEVAAHFGEVLWQLQQRKKAQEIWQKTLIKHPNNTTLKETIKRLQKILPAKKLSQHSTEKTSFNTINQGLRKQHGIPFNKV